jgi:large subunit ribosomal protein L22
MGVRKRLAAQERKEAKKSVADARLNNCPTSPRKMRLLADLVRGMKVEQALNLLKYNPKEASGRLEKLLLSAISNWQSKNEGVRVEDADLFVKEVFVDSARQLKRLRPAPQGRGYRVRKRSNHVTLILDSATTVTTNE